LRLFIPPLSKEVSWLLPFGLLGAVLLVTGSPVRWPLSPDHQAAVLWGGWLLAGGIFFSVAGFFHEYYLSMLAPPLAALLAIGAIRLWRLSQVQPWVATLLLVATATATLGFQVFTARAFSASSAWLLPAFACLVVGGGLLLAAPGRGPESLALAGFACVIAAMLIIPGIWSGLTTANASANQSLPSAYAGSTSGPANQGGLQVSQELLDYLEPRTRDTVYLMAVPSSMQGADYVLATGRPVLYLGGFMGQDQVLTNTELEEMVQQGELRFIFSDTRPAGFNRPAGSSNVSGWVAAYCTPVPGFETAMRNLGAPDGTGAGQGPSTNQQNRGFPGGMPATLYDCGR
jgi:4-amino-4-deoxy-L-arabinose transferase-like glycosyltransferase